MELIKSKFDIESYLKEISPIMSGEVDRIQTMGIDELKKIDKYGITKTTIAALCVHITFEGWEDSGNDEEQYLRKLKQIKLLIPGITQILSESDDFLDIEINGFYTFFAQYTFRDKIFDEIIDVAAKLNSFIIIMNSKFESLEMPKVKIGIGIDKDEAYITRVLHSSSSLDELYWDSQIWRKLSFLAESANFGLVKSPIIISKTVMNEMEGAYKEFFSYNSNIDAFYASLINRKLNNWFKLNCK